MPTDSIPDRVTALEQAVIKLTILLDAVQTKVNTIEWSADHVGAERHPNNPEP